PCDVEAACCALDATALSLGPRAEEGIMSLDGVQGGAQAQPDFDAEPVCEPEAPDPEPVVSRLPTFLRPTPVAAAQGIGGPARPPEETVRDFYEAFTHSRFDEVAKIYAPDVRYHDPLFDHGDSSSTIH